MNDQLYRRSMGYSYDSRALEREIANGYAVRDAEPVPEEPLSESDLLFVEVNGSDNDIRLQEIEFELAQTITPSERVILEAEKTVRREQRRLDELAEEHPLYAHALQDWLMSEMQRLFETDAVIDDEMVAEAEILDQIIAEVSAEHEEQPLIKLAEVMKNVIEARKTLEITRNRVEHSLAA